MSTSWHLGRQQRRRRHRQHDSEGGRQQIQRRQRRSLLQQEHDERQPERRADRPRAQERQSRSTTFTMPASRSADRSKKTCSGSSARFASGATSGRPPTSSITLNAGTRLFYTPDLSRPGYAQGMVRIEGRCVSPGRPSDKSKFNFFADPQRDCHCPGADGERIAQCARSVLQLPPQARRPLPDDLERASHQQAAASKPASRGPMAAGRSTGSRRSRPTTFPSPSSRPACGTTRARRHSAPPTTPTAAVPRFSERFSASYVTGSHAFKAGFQLEQTYIDAQARERHPQSRIHVQQSACRRSLTQWATPYGFSAQNKDFGFFAQDQWTLSRVTVTSGVRYEYFNGYIPAAECAGHPERLGPRAQLRRSEQRPVMEGPRSPARRGLRRLWQRPDGAESRDGPLRLEGGDCTMPQANNPIQTSINSVTRTWNDSFYPVGDPRRGNYVPDCDLSNRGAQRRVRRHGQPELRRQLQRHHPLRGRCPASAYGARGYNWDFTAEVQHELRPGVSMYRRLLPQLVRQLPGHGQHAGDPSDFDPFCVTAPRTRVCRAAADIQSAVSYDVTPAKFGQVNSVITQSDNFGKMHARQRFLQRDASTRGSARHPGRRRCGSPAAA